MMQKNIGHVKKILWSTGILLGCFGGIEAGQEVVRAIEVQTQGNAPSLPADHAAPAPDLDLRLNRQARSSATVQPDPAIKPSPQARKLAISVGDANDPQQQIAQITPNQVATSTWEGASFPVENFQAYTSPFGYRSSPYGGYSQEFHYGLDMAAPEGSYIRSWWGGKVVEVSDDSNCGTSVVVESGPWLHIYCHMQGHVEKEDGKRYMIDREGGVQIWENQQLPAGSRIGRVGMTGRTTGPHLHWGLKYNENWVDPALVLRAMYFNQQQTTALKEDRVQ